jgi:hypothetical protein
MLLQKQDNNLKQNPMYKLIQLAFLVCCAIPNPKKSRRSFISNTVTLKAGLLTRKKIIIVKGTFWIPGKLQSLSLIFLAVFS